MKKTYEKPTMVSAQTRAASSGACGRSGYGGCGKLVQRD